MEFTMEKDFEDKLYGYLIENQRIGFTIMALRERLNKFVIEPEVRKYGRRNLQKILNKMRDNDKVKSTKYEKKTYYSFLAPAKLVSLKNAGDKQIQERTITARAAQFGGGGIFLIIGIIMISIGLPFSITLLIIGIVFIAIGICLLTGGYCLWCFD
jgi:hypothetical protein